MVLNLAELTAILTDIIHGLQGRSYLQTGHNRPLPYLYLLTAYGHHSLHSTLSVSMKPNGVVD
jgi:hypothetical protein